jgi:formate dehydrogenase subunit gamma
MCGFIRDKTPKAVARRKRIVLTSFAILLASVVLLPLGSYLYSGLSAQAAAEEQTNPRANYWRAVRDGNAGYTAVVGQETNILIQNGGQNWRQWRNGPVANISPWFLAFVLLALGLLFLLRGAIKVEGDLSGRTVARYNIAERVIHWYVAILFIILAVTGLSLLFGRAVLIPMLGASGFAGWANFSILLHNYLGPFFTVGVVLAVVAWIKDNIPTATDWQWFKEGVGGLLAKGKHPSAGRFNAGEKVFVFWIGMIVLGVTVSVTGFILIGWIGEGMRATMQTSSIIHAAASIVWIGIVCGHIYLALATQGALEGMTRGQVSEEWAKQHHDLWYQGTKKG